uniref:Uncharacterized protein n=1 Tax=Chrysotila carterae TaxID=13221 RepID=A0A7S4EUA4_CHRCT|mmetsp:Transcript_18298/g.38713  ORF Transcript_18298/g.38713 Transcript_18298/m.38713 type:complete len:139 (+) Transcript_18298:458-874(+)
MDGPVQHFEISGNRASAANSVGGDAANCSSHAATAIPATATFASAPTTASGLDEADFSNRCCGTGEHCRPHSPSPASFSSTGKHFLSRSSCSALPSTTSQDCSSYSTASFPSPVTTAMPRSQRSHARQRLPHMRLCES